MKILVNAGLIQKPCLNELQDIIRGVSGGLLFGIPLLYTMEVWQIGSLTKPPALLVIISVTYIVVFLLNQEAGFRNKRYRTLKNSLMESVEALAIGLVCSAFILILLQQINPLTSLDEALGKVILEGVPFSIGVVLSKLILSQESPPPAEQTSGQSYFKPQKFQKNKISLRATIDDVSATFLGALFVGFNIAPTEEVRVLAGKASAPWLIAIITVSLLISYCIVFAAGFRNQQERHSQKGLFQTPKTETIVSYFISLITSVLMLWFFQQLSFSDPGFLWLRSTLILGLPATIGGAAGRLAI